MKKSELHAKLQVQYKKGMVSGGVVKSRDEKFKHLWFVVPPTPPRDRPANLPLKLLAKAHKVLDRLPLVEQADELDKLVSYLFIRREAVQSSRMEGTYSTIDQVLTPGDIWENDESQPERSSVIGYANALEQEIESCLAKGINVFQIAMVKRVHKLIMEKEPRFKGKPGAIRGEGKDESVVWIGGGGRAENSVFNPPPSEYVKTSLVDVLDWMADPEIEELGDAGMGLSLPLRMAIAHAHFEGVHPFADGNGRVGRVLMTLQMACSHKIPIYISGYIEANKREYVSALASAQKKLDYTPIVEFVCEALIDSFEEAEVTKAAIRSLPQEWMARGGFRLNSAAHRALSVIFKNPIFSAKMLENELSVSKPASMRAVTQLLEGGIVRERTGFSRNRVFAAEEVIQILSRDFNEPVSESRSKARKLLQQSTK